MAETMGWLANEAAEKKLDEVMDCVLEKLGHGYTVSARKIQKANGVVLMGLIIDDGSESTVPVVCLADEDLEKAIPEIVDMAISKYQNSKDIDASRLSSAITDREYALEHVVYQLVGTDANRKMLETMPHKELLDMSAIYVITWELFGKLCSVKVNDRLFRSLNVTVEALDENAKRNTTERGILFVNLDDIQEWIETGAAPHGTSIEESTFENGVSVFALTNPDSHLGASLLMYPEILDKIAERAGSDLFIFPSSIHEVIVTPYSSDISIKSLYKMVRDINRTEVSPEDVLTDSVYRYSRTKKMLQVARGVSAYEKEAGQH